jgi:hypothetical protein
MSGGGGGPLDFDDEPRGPGAPSPAPSPGAREPDPGPPPPARRRRITDRSTWAIGVVALVFVVLVTINAVGGDGVSPGGPQPGDDLPPFATPLASAPPREDEDANVDLERACSVRGEGILNICEEAEQGPVVFALFPTDAGRCRRVLDQFARVRPRLPEVRFVAVGSRGDRADLRARRVPFPLGWDRDGAVATAYGLVGCPQITFARRGGRVVETTRKELSDAELVRRAAGL